MAILDETDSGLDIDALQNVASGIEKSRSRAGDFLITHYKILNTFNRTLFMCWPRADRQIRWKELALELESKGYDWVLKEQRRPAVTR